MAPTAAIIVPTRSRADYLDVALASIAPQAAAAGAELIVVDDGPSEATRAMAAKHHARYLAHDRTQGLNAARNTGIGATTADLVVFTDDDVEVRDGWLRALLDAAEREPGDVGVLTGPIHARFEDHRLSMCGREGPPITALDFGPQDIDAPHAWGANMAIRRSAIDAAGRFDETLPLYGDEQEWQDRLRAQGLRIRYIAAAALEHRRAGDDARLRSLSSAAYHRGRASRRYDVFRRRAPSAASELATLARTAVHPIRFRCANGIVMAAHSAGRTREALARTPPPLPQATTDEDDFLSGASGTVGGRRGRLLRAEDAALDVQDLVSGRRLKARRLSRTRPTTPQRVLALGIERPDVENLMAEAKAELARTRHRVEVHTAPMGTKGKFENLNALLAQHNLAAYHWLMLVDDDVDLPRHFVDVFLALADQAGLRLAQPAHRLHSHAAWPVTRRVPGSLVRRTTFVEIGPVTAFHRETFETLLPFPDLRMGWGLDVHWSAVAQQHGWPIGIVDATPVGHTLRPAADTYPREQAAAEARAFLEGKPYVRRHEVRTIE